jgi:hypothetical protein
MTAMQHLQKEIDDRIEHAKYSVVADELKVIRNIIDMGMIDMEREWFEYAYDSSTGYGTFGIDMSGKEFYDKTFKQETI